jgi:hypothetical protein
VQHRHPYTKGQSGGANNQHPHQTTSVHDQNLSCAGRLSRFGTGVSSQGRRLTPLITALATVILLDTPHVEPKCHGEFVRLLVVVSRSEAGKEGDGTARLPLARTVPGGWGCGSGPDVLGSPAQVASPTAPRPPPPVPTVGTGRASPGDLPSARCVRPRSPTWRRDGGVVGQVAIRLPLRAACGRRLITHSEQTARTQGRSGGRNRPAPSA